MVAAIGVSAQSDPTVWDGSKSSSLTVDGKKIYIYTAADLAALHELWDDYDDGDQGYKGYTIYLMDDLDMNNLNFNDHTIGWDDKHKFGGDFDGQGHIIRNLKIEGNDNNRGLFGKMDNGKVMNLKLVDVDIHVGDGDDCHIGAICGRMYNHSTITHCAVVGGSVRKYENGNDEFGAICGYMTNNHNSVEYCYSNITVEADAEVGGLVGKIEQGGDHTSGIYHSYFSGTVIHSGDDYFGAICGERYGQPMQNCFFFDRLDGVKATGNQKSAGGSSYHTNKSEIKECTDEELKAPLLFGADNLEWIYPLDGYPELKVFLRYQIGDSFYDKTVGHMDNNAAVAGYLKLVRKNGTPHPVSLEKTMAAPTNTGFSINNNFTPYFSDQQLEMVALGINALEGLGVVNSVTVPTTIDSICYPQRHQVQQAFIVNGTEGAVKDGALYDVTRKYLITAPKTFTTLTIHQEFADNIADYAFENMSNMKTLYVDTWLPAGTLVDDGDNKAPIMQLKGDNIFNGCSSDLDIYVKDGTTNQLFLGHQGPKGYGYRNTDGWDNFYSDYQDVDNHLFSYFPVKRNQGGMSTLILGYPVELPEGVTAWWARSISGGRLNMGKIASQVVPALTPVLLAYEGTTEPLYLSRYEGSNPGAATDYESNLFKGSVDPGGHTMTSSEMTSNFLTLGRPAGDNTYNNLGFYQFHPTNNILPSYVAWLAASDIPTDARLMISFNDGDMTGITNINNDGNVNYYNLSGQRVTKPTKGLYIVGGRKVFIR